MGAGDTSEGVGLGHLPLLPRKQPREVSKGSDQAEVRGHLGGGGGAVALASLLLTTLPPAVLPGLQGPRSPEDGMYRASSSGSTALRGRQ